MAQDAHGLEVTAAAMLAELHDHASLVLERIADRHPLPPRRRVPWACDKKANAMNAVTGAHLIGSVPLPDAEAVFRTVARTRTVSRMHSRWRDRNRGRWIWWQRKMLLRHPAMEPDADPPPFELRQWNGALLRTTDWLRSEPASIRRRRGSTPGYALGHAHM